MAGPAFGDVVVRDAAGNVLRVDPAYTFHEHRAVVDPVAHRRDTNGVVGPFIGERASKGGEATAKIRAGRRWYAPPEPPLELPPTVKHGTRYAFGRYKCRCVACLGREREYRRERNERERERRAAARAAA